jgi:hypothetical protein
LKQSDVGRVRCLLLSVLLAEAVIGISVQAQRPSPALRTIEVCRVELTAAGSAASFQGTAVYELVAMAMGGLKQSETFTFPTSWKDWSNCVSCVSACDVGDSPALELVK